MKDKLQILIVDDDRRMTRTLADIFSISGHEVMEAYSGPEALELVQTTSFDCVLTDVKMPGMDGVEFHNQLRQVRPGLPVILMTAYAANELIQKGLDEGIVGVFDKPLDINNLLAFFTSLAKHRSIVIVDNDTNFCRTLDDILSHRGFRVTQITDPHVPVELMTKDAQVILLDIKLNHINGYDVLKEIRKQYAELPVLLVTGYQKEMSHVIEAAMGIDAFACLYKPLEIQELLDLLTQLQLKRLRNILKPK